MPENAMLIGLITGLLGDVGSDIAEALGGAKTFIRPFRAMEGSDHYALDVTRAPNLLGWSPTYRWIDPLAFAAGQ